MKEIIARCYIPLQRV